MKTILTTILIMTCFFGFSQDKKDKKNKKIEIIDLELNKKFDSLNKLFVQTKDSLDIFKKEDKNKSKETKKETITTDFNLDYILIGDQRWCATNIGDANSILKNWIVANKFYRCSSEQEWIDKVNSNTPAFYVLKNELNNVGYFFNIEGLKKLQNNPPKGWRIANIHDFEELIEYVNNLKIKSITSLQLILGNYNYPIEKNTTKLHPLTWTGLPTHNIYNLSLYPVSYFSGFESLLTYNNLLNLFSRYDEETNKIYFTEISSSNKTSIVERKLGSEAYDYGFLVRLIKK
jgi:hypothetical protein